MPPGAWYSVNHWDFLANPTVYVYCNRIVAGGHHEAIKKHNIAGEVGRGDRETLAVSSVFKLMLV